VQARKKFPREGKTLVTEKGREKVVSVDIWRERLLLKDEEGNRRTVALAELKAEVARAGGEAGAAPAGAAPRDGGAERGERGLRGGRPRREGDEPRPGNGNGKGQA
jgi:hypothetical protein